MAEGRRAVRPTSPRRGSSPLVELMVLALGFVLTGVVWVFLVNAAIDFGRLALHTQPAAWLFALGAAAGAMVCLLLMVALVGRAMRKFGFLSDYKPRRAAAKRRR